MRLPVKEIKPNPNNPRFIKDDNFKKLVQSLKDFPEMAEVREVVVNKDYTILGGNMRYKAMVEAGWTEVPVKVVDWPEDKQQEFVIKDNVSGGDWDWDILANEWDAELLDEWGLETPDNWGETEVEEDEAPEVSSEPAKSVLGEIYQLGRHRVMCGDSTDKANVELLMDGDKADMVFTDPPYGMFLNTDFSQIKGSAKSIGFKGKVLGNKYDKVIGDNDDFTPEIINSIFANYNYCKEMFIWGADYFIDLLPNHGKDGCLLVWSKRSSDEQQRGIGNCFELFWSKQQHKKYVFNFEWFGFLSKDAPQEARNRVHPTMKPVGLIERIWKWYDSPNGIVADIFLGSGSTLIASEKTGRNCYGMERDPKYVDVIRKRYTKLVNGTDEGWEEFTKAGK